MTVFIVLTLAIAGCVPLRRRLNTDNRAVFYLTTAFVTLMVAGFGIVVPAVRPAEQQLQPLLSSDGAGLLLFLCTAATVGVAATSMLAAEFAYVLAVTLVQLVLLSGRQVRAVVRAVSSRRRKHDPSPTSGLSPQSAAPESARQDTGSRWGRETS